MIQLSPQIKVWICNAPVDFRAGIDGLAQVCREKLQRDPFSGQFFLFINRRKTSIKCLVYDGQGFWLMQKRLSEGKFRHWPPHECEYEARRAQVLLHNGNPDTSQFQNEWRKI